MTNLMAQVDMDSIKINYVSDNKSLSEVFDDLENDYGIKFSYATSALLEQRVTVSFEDESVDDVLKIIFQDKNMEYKIVANNILVRKAKEYDEINDSAYKKGLHLRGRVVKPGNTSEGVEMATIAINNTSIGTYTDTHGRFDIEIPERYITENLIFHALGFEDKVYQISELSESFLMIPLENDGISISEVTIINHQKPIKVDNLNNSLSLSKTLLNNSSLGLSGGDISRQLQVLPGISGHDDTSAEIKIRGSNSDETMIFLDGMPIYHASHYYGIFSSVNSSYVDSINVYKNNYPLQYDGKTGGVVELFSNDDQVKKLKGSVELNLLTASTDVSVPLSDHSMIKVAGRTTLGNVSNSQFNTFAPKSDDSEFIEDFKEPRRNRSTEPKFQFFDLNMSFQSKIRKFDILKIDFYSSKDIFSNYYNNHLQNNLNDRLELFAKESANWNNLVLGLEYNMKLSKQINWYTKFHRSSYTNTQSTEYTINRKINSGPHKTSVLGAKQTNNLTDTGLSSYLSFIRSDQSFQLGLSTIRYDIDYDIQENVAELINGENSFYETAIYAEYKGMLTDKMSINTGLRGSYYSHIKNSYLSPRILINYKIYENINAKASYGYYQQLVRQLQYEYRGEPMSLWVNAGQNNIPVLNSHKMMIGATLHLGILTFDIEMYQKNMDGMLEYAVLKPGNGSTPLNEPRDYRLFRGNGISRGIDFLLSTGYDTYDTYLIYTLSKSEQRFKAIAKNKYFPTEDDRRHQLKWINNIKTGKITWGFNTILVSGRRYTDINNLGIDGDITEVSPENRWKRLPAYQRLDISATFDFNLFNNSSSLSLSIINLLNSQNVKYVQSVSAEIVQNQIPINTVIGSESNLLGRTLNLSWCQEF